MALIKDKEKLIALSHLHSGKTAREIEEMEENELSYAQIINLRGKLKEAVEANKLDQLFNLSDIVLDAVIEHVYEDLEETVEVLTGDVMPIINTLEEIKDQIGATKILEVEIAKAGAVLAAKIAELAGRTENVDAVAKLATAVSGMQTAFFKSNSVQIANFGAGDKFEEFLSK